MDGILLMEQSNPLFAELRKLNDRLSRLEKQEAEKAMLPDEAVHPGQEEHISPFGMARISTSGMIHYANQSFKKFTHCEQAVGQPISEIPGFKQDQQLAAKLLTFLTTQKPFSHQLQISEAPVHQLYRCEASTQKNNGPAQFWLSLAPLNQLPQAHNQEENTEIHFQLIRLFSEQILNAQNWPDKIDFLLEETGKLLAVKRVFLAQNSTEDLTAPAMRFIHSWDKKQHPKTGTIEFADQPYIHGLEMWKELLENGHPVFGHDESFPGLVQEWLNSRGTASILLAPIFCNNHLWGTLGIEEGETQRTWTKSEVQLVITLGSIIGSGIQKSEPKIPETMEELLFENLFQSSPEAIVLATEKGQIIRTNKQFAKLFGFTEHESKGQNIDLILNPATAQSEAACLTEAVTQGTPVEIETERQHKNGTMIDVSILGVPMDLGNNHKAVYGIYRDITQKKQQQIRLVQNELKFRTIFEYSPMGLMLLDHAGRVIESTKKILHIFGVDSREEFESFNLFTDPNIPSEVKEQIRIGKTAHFRGWYEFSDIRKHHIYNTKKFYPIYLDCIFTQVPGPDEIRGILMFVNDITERRLEEIELEDSQTKFKTLFESATDAIFLLKNDRILECNPQSLTMLSTTREQVSGESILSFSPENQPDNQTSKEKFDKIIQSVMEGKSISTEWQFVQKDGPITETQMSLNRVQLKENYYLQAIVHDISYRKRSERALIGYKNTSKAFINASSDHLLLINKDLKIEMANEAFASSYEHQADQLTGLSLRDILPLSILKSREQIIKHVIDSRQPFYYSDDFDNRFLEHHLSPILDSRGDVEQIAINTRDITEKKKVENQLTQAKEQAEESDKLKTAFLASMSHEIRTPMNHIIGFIDLIRSQNPNEQDRNEYLDIVNTSSNLLLRLIDDIIDIAKIESGQLPIEKNQFSLDTIISNTECIFKEQSIDQQKEHIQLEISAPHQLEEIHLATDQTRLQQVLINLMHNALKFTERGSIQLRVEYNEYQQLQFAVSDTGIGISEKEQAVIFERFRQVDYDYNKKYCGTGLGLALCKGIVELLGGIIWVESSEGSGSTFKFTLPKDCILNGHPEAEEEPETNIAFDFSQKTILLVEDDRMNMKMLQAFLEKTNARLTIAKTGQQAIDSTQNDPADLILMDIQLPDIDGYECTQRIKVEHPDIPIIVQTAHVFPEEKRRAFQSGCDDYLSKPLRKNELLTKINQLLTQSSSLNI